MKSCNHQKNNHHSPSVSCSIPCSCKDLYAHTLTAQIFLALILLCLTRPAPASQIGCYLVIEGFMWISYENIHIESEDESHIIVSTVTEALHKSRCLLCSDFRQANVKSAWDRSNLSKWSLSKASQQIQQKREEKQEEEVARMAAYVWSSGYVWRLEQINCVHWRVVPNWDLSSSSSCDPIPVSFFLAFFNLVKRGLSCCFYILFYSMK